MNGFIIEKNPLRSAILQLLYVNKHRSFVVFESNFQDGIRINERVSKQGDFYRYVEERRTDWIGYVFIPKENSDLFLHIIPEIKKLIKQHQLRGDW